MSLSDLDAMIEKCKAKVAELDALEPEPRHNIARQIMRDIMQGIEPGPGLLDSVEAIQALHSGENQGIESGSEDEGEDDAEDDSDVRSEHSQHIEGFDDGEDEEGEEFDEELLVNFLSGLHTAIVAKQNVQPIATIPGLKPHFHPLPHQLRAAAAAIHAKDGQFKGLILADPPGLGKTLSALMAIAAASHPGIGPSVIVAPLSSCRQWMNEIESTFDQSVLPRLCHLGGTLSHNKLLKYKIVVTSYSYVSSELGRMLKFRLDLERYRLGKTKRLPQRPFVTFLSGIFDFPGARPIGQFVVLDEPQIIKNTKSRTYAAISILRSRFNACLMLRGTQLDNAWLENFSLLSMLRGHPITSLPRMRLAFADEASTAKGGRTKPIPTGYKLVRLIQMMDAVTLRRPPVVTEIVDFDLPLAELEESNAAFKRYQQSSEGEPHSSENQRGPKTVHRGRQNDADELIEAQQHAYHPKLAMLMRLEQRASSAGLDGKGDMNRERENERNRDISLVDLKKQLGRDKNWRSERVFSISDTICKHLSMWPADAFLVMDESESFLDIVEMAVKFDSRIPCFRYDGRLGPAERNSVLEDFCAAKGPRAMLASPASRGWQGLNLQCANVLIRCGAWWKASMEEQAECRLQRPGQTKQVFVYELRANQCAVEAYIVKMRDEEKSQNSKIMDAITRSDDVNVMEPRFIC